MTINVSELNRKIERLREKKKQQFTEEEAIWLGGMHCDAHPDDEEDEHGE